MVLLRTGLVVVVGMVVIQDAMTMTTDHPTEVEEAAMEVIAVQEVPLEATVNR